MVGRLAAGGDAATLVTASALAVVVLDAPLWPSAAAGAMLLGAALAGGRYRRRAVDTSPVALVLPWLAAGLATLLLIRLTGQPRAAVQALAIWALLSAVGLSAWRLWLGRRGGARGLFGGRAVRIVILGSGNAGPLLDAIGASNGGGTVVLRAHHAADCPPDAVLVQRLQRGAAKGHFDVVVLALPWTAPALLERSCAALRHLTVDLWLVADPHSPAALTLRTGPVPEVAMLPIAVRPLAGWRGVAKRAGDVALASVLLLTLSPVMLVTAALVAANSRGPVMLRQRRFGFGNVAFSIYKFRTMYHDKGDQSGARATVPGDQRVTRVGRFLRASSLDELPQLFNVLKGEMSLVGPRPHPVEMRVLGKYYHDAVPGYKERHRVKPGITGLAQVNGYRGLVDTLEKAEGRLAWDLAYVERWSLGMDIRILGRTLLKGFFGSGAF